jgi:hypothetical protein
VHRAGPHRRTPADGRRAIRAGSGRGQTETHLTSPRHAELGFTNAVRKKEGNMWIATFKIKNLAAGPIAGLRIEEFWYDKGGDIVAGAEPFRYRKPLARAR